ncbi:MAG: TIGR04282 family arsenosugar biosynthesis glycosyltransferase [Rhodospirillales bacterium]
MSRLVRHLVVFMKTPKAGAVKTRLAKDTGVVNACAFYRHMSAALLRRLSADPRWRTWIAFTPDREPPPLRALGARRGTCRLIRQGPGDLGGRMNRVMQTLPAGPVVIVGTDIPDISPAHIQEAFTALGAHDAVFGPCDDGGYWLVGLKRRPTVPEIFETVRWSSAHALEDTLANFPPEYRIALLEKLEDVDDGESFRRWRKRADC